MDYEKLYKEALEKARIFKEHLIEISQKGFADEMEYIFPELAESEDDKVRKAIIGHIKGLRFYDSYYGVTPDEMIAWLENQASKPKWTEEDESKVKEIVYFLDTAKVHYASTTALDDCIEWIKLLKQRME